MDYKKRISSLCLMMHENCNMGCIYCFEKKKAGKKITTETLINSWNILKKSDVNNLEIMVFGGEPLLAIDKLDELVNIIAKELKEDSSLKEKRVNFSIITNTTIYNEEVEKVLSKINKTDKLSFSLQFSVDGVKEIQNFTRPMLNGNDSYNLIMENMKKYKKLIESFGLNIYNVCTVHPVITEIGAKHLYQNYKNLKEYGSFWFVPVSDSGSWDYKNILILKNQIHKIFDYIVKERVKGNDKEFLKFTNLKKILDGYGKNHTRPCGFGSQLHSISAEGDIYPCHRFKFNIENGDLKEGNINKEDIDEILKKSKFINDMIFEGENDLVNSEGEKCSECFAKPYCYICPALNWEKTSSLNISHSDQCQVMKEMTETLMSRALHYMQSFPEDAPERSCEEDYEKVKIEDVVNLQHKINEQLESKIKYLKECVEILTENMSYLLKVKPIENEHNKSVG